MDLVPTYRVNMCCVVLSQGKKKNIFTKPETGTSAVTLKATQINRLLLKQWVARTAGI